MIQSFADATTADLCAERKSKAAWRVPRDYRITFRWENHDAHDVCCEDYH